jgi:hypothetical protein
MYSQAIASPGLSNKASDACVIELLEKSCSGSVRLKAWHRPFCSSVLLGLSPRLSGKVLVPGCAPSVALSTAIALTIPQS